MKEQLSNKILSSFYLYFDNKVLKDGEAFTNVPSGKLYFQVDPKISPSNTAVSNRKQWVYDSGISGAIIPTGAFVNGSFSDFATLGASPDFINGRVIGSSLNSSSDYYTSYSYKNVNLYLTDKTEEEIIFDTYGLSVKMNAVGNSGIAPYKYALPATFLFILNGDCKPLQLGDEDNMFNKFVIRAVTVMDDNFMHDAVHGIGKRMAYKHFPLVNSSMTPLNERGGFKSSLSGVYRYDSLCSGAKEFVYIERVRSSKISYGSHEILQKNAKFGFIDFSVEFVGEA